jgi:hypothetical protein
VPCALRRWLDAAQLQCRPVFRHMYRGDRLGECRPTDQSVALIVKRRSRQAGLPPEQLSGHSLRAGYATAARAGIEERKIASVNRHKNLPMLRSYIRAATAFDNVGEVLLGEWWTSASLRRKGRAWRRRTVGACPSESGGSLWQRSGVGQRSDRVLHRCDERLR